MKKIESLGRSLNRSEQKSITGGTSGDLYCTYYFGDSFHYIGTYGSGCMAELTRVCAPSTDPYAQCKCTPATIPMTCGN